jgi:shikimate dehydrogenase
VSAWTASAEAPTGDRSPAAQNTVSTARRPTYRLALVGSGIEKSLAPAFHTTAGAIVGLDVTYDLFPRTPNFAARLDEFLVELAAAGYRGINVTVPFKATAWRAAVDPSISVVAMGVANTLLLGHAGPTHAFNTDFTGFKWAYRRRFGTTSPGSVAVLGAGGVGTSTATALVDLGATAVRLYDIVPDRSQELVDVLRARDGACAVSVASSAEVAVEGVEGVVNATPVGMYFQPGSPVDLAAIGPQRWLFDAIYSPVETELMIRAVRAGLERISGFDLFIGQGIDAFEIFTGRGLSPSVLAVVEERMRIAERRRGL